MFDVSRTPTTIKAVLHGDAKESDSNEEGHYIGKESPRLSVNMEATKQACSIDQGRFQLSAFRGLNPACSRL